MKRSQEISYRKGAGTTSESLGAIADNATEHTASARTGHHIRGSIIIRLVVGSVIDVVVPIIVGLCFFWRLRRRIQEQEESVPEWRKAELLSKDLDVAKRAVELDGSKDLAELEEVRVPLEMEETAPGTEVEDRIMTVSQAVSWYLPRLPVHVRTILQHYCSNYIVHYEERTFLHISCTMQPDAL